MLRPVPDNLSTVLQLVRESDRARLAELDGQLTMAEALVRGLAERCRSLWVDFGEPGLRECPKATKDAVSSAVGFDAVMDRVATMGDALRAASVGDHLEVASHLGGSEQSPSYTSVAELPPVAVEAIATPDVAVHRDPVEGYLDDLRWRNRSPSTIYQRRRLLVRFGAGIAPVPPLQASAEDIRTWLRRPMRGPGERSVSAVINDRAGLASFYKWAVQEGLREENPCDRIPRPRLNRSVPHPISESDLQRAIDTARPRVRPMLYLAAYAGLRAGEIAQLRGEDVDLDKMLLTIQRQKGGDQTRVPISPIVAEVLVGMPRRGWLFPRIDGGAGPVPAHRVSKMANDHLHELGIWLTLHSLRHRFATQVYRASGRDIRATQELMRHRTIASTQIYTAVDAGEAAATVACLPGARPTSSAR